MLLHGLTQPDEACAHLPQPESFTQDASQEKLGMELAQLSRT
jgi:hypothetical protein